MKLIKRIILTLFLMSCYISIITYIFGMSCPLKILFGIPCPGCGMTRAIIAILQLDFQAALHYHPMIVFLPFLAYIMIQIIAGKVTKKLINLLAFIVLLFLVTYCLRLYLKSDILSFAYSDSFIYKIFHTIHE